LRIAATPLIEKLPEAKSDAPVSFEEFLQGHSSRIQSEYDFLRSSWLVPFRQPLREFSETLGPQPYDDVADYANRVIAAVHQQFQYELRRYQGRFERGQILAQGRERKSILAQMLVLRGSRDFSSVEEYQRWVREVIGREHNAALGDKLVEEHGSYQRRNGCNGSMRSWIIRCFGGLDVIARTNALHLYGDVKDTYPCGLASCDPAARCSSTPATCTSSISVDVCAAGRACQRSFAEAREIDADQVSVSASPMSMPANAPLSINSRSPIDRDPCGYFIATDVFERNRRSSRRDIRAPFI
jgi:hypothetical protein